MEDIKEDFGGIPVVKTPLPPALIELSEDLDFILKIENILEVLKKFFQSQD